MRRSTNLNDVLMKTADILNIRSICLFSFILGYSNFKLVVYKA